MQFLYVTTHDSQTLNYTSNSSPCKTYTHTIFFLPAATRRCFGCFLFSICSVLWRRFIHFTCRIALFMGFQLVHRLHLHFFYSFSLAELFCCCLHIWSLFCSLLLLCTICCCRCWKKELRGCFTLEFVRFYAPFFHSHSPPPPRPLVRARDSSIHFAMVCTSYQIKILVTFTYRGNTLTPHISIYRSYCSLCHDLLVVSWFKEWKYARLLFFFSRAR